MRIVYLCICECVCLYVCLCTYMCVREKKVPFSSPLNQFQFFSLLFCLVLFCSHHQQYSELPPGSKLKRLLLQGLGYLVPKKASGSAVCKARTFPLFYHFDLHLFPSHWRGQEHPILWHWSSASLPGIHLSLSGLHGLPCVSFSSLISPLSASPLFVPLATPSLNPSVMRPMIFPVGI